jgi:hypothetical protein
MLLYAVLCRHVFKRTDVSMIVRQGGVKMKDYTHSTIIKVKCDCCGKDIECPEEMLKTSKKHLCYTCFQDPKSFKNFKQDELKNVHVDIPLEKFADEIADNFATMMVNEAFPKIWSDKKEDLKELSKKDLSKEMFGAGVYMGVQAFVDSMQESGKKKK